MNSFCQRCLSNPVSQYQSNLYLCSYCAAAYVAPPVPSILKFYGATRHCHNCGLEVSNTIAQCDCGYLELGLVPDEAAQPTIQPVPSTVSLVMPNPCWTCTACGFEYNQESTCFKCAGAKPGQELDAIWLCVCGFGNQRVTQCARCQRPKDAPTDPLPSYSESVPQLLLNCGRNPNPSGNSLWKCTVCEYEYNPPRNTFCQSFACAEALKQKQIKEIIAEDARWICPECGTENSRLIEVCVECNLKKGWECYLQFKNVSMNAENSKWICECGEMEELMVYCCRKCNQVNLAIMKGLQGKGKETSLLYRIKQWIWQKDK